MRFLFKQSYDDDIRLLKHSGYVRGTLLWLMIALLLPFYFMWAGVEAATLKHVIHILTFAMCSMGLMILTGYTGQVSLGHGAFFALGAYCVHFLLKLGLPWAASFVITPLAIGLLGYVLARPTLRMSGVTLAITTLLFVLFVEQAFKQWAFMGGGNGFQTPKFIGQDSWFLALFQPLALLLTESDPDNRRDMLLLTRSLSKYALYYGALMALIFVIWLMNNLQRSRLGRALIAIRDSEVSAQSMGINLNHTKSLAMALSAAIGALAGVFNSYNDGLVAPESVNFITSIVLLLIIVVGGLGSIHGAILGAVTYVGLREILFPGLAGAFDAWAAGGGGTLAAALAWVFNIGGLGDIFFALLVLLILFYEPLGLYARWKKTEAFFQTFPFYRAGTFRRQRTYARTDRLR